MSGKGVQPPSLRTKKFVMFSNHRAKITFASAVALLVLSSLTVYVLISRYSENEKWVSHTHEVQDAVRDSNFAMSRAARARLSFVASGQESAVQAFDAAIPDVYNTIEQIRTLTRDNPKQQELCSRLRETTQQRIAISIHSIAARRNWPQDKEAQEDVTKALVPLVYESAAIIQQMYDEEERILKTRMMASHLLFRRTGVVLVFTLILALILFAAHYRLISLELKTRKQAEECLRVQNLELMSANKELDSFSYSVSHDLRGPLMAVDGFATMLLEDWQKSLDPQAQNQLKDIRRAAARMARMIDDLLGLARVTRGQLVRQEVNLGELSKQIAADLRQAEPDRDVAFIAPENIIIEADPGLLRIALENLLRNSWKFTSKRDQASIVVGVKDHGAETTYFVRDNGAGFDMRHANRLFRPFQRLHIAADFPGTGIGLATVERVIRRHGGTVWAESTPGEGATFYFKLGSRPSNKGQETDIASFLAV
jgi:signal transduction histidine kinase